MVAGSPDAYALTRPAPIVSRCITNFERHASLLRSSATARLTTFASRSYLAENLVTALSLARLDAVDVQQQPEIAMLTNC